MPESKRKLEELLSITFTEPYQKLAWISPLVLKNHDIKFKMVKILLKFLFITARK